MNTMNNTIYKIESKQPVTIDLGNLIYNKEIKKAISKGKRELKKDPNNPGIHINLMVAYYKLRNDNKKYLDLSTFHAKQAMINGHNTGLAQKRIVLNLEKELKINQAIDFCNIILSNKFHFSKFGSGDKEYFKDKLVKLEKKIHKAVDQIDDEYFTIEEVMKACNNCTIDGSYIY